MALSIRKGDLVLVISGKDRGVKGKVIEVYPDSERVIVEGVNLVKRHTRQTAQSEGGIISKEATIDLSNLAIADPKDGKASRVGFKVLDDGRKVRVAGIVLIRQRPGKGNAVFITIEDETGVANALLWARDMEKQRRAVMASRLMRMGEDVRVSTPVSTA